MIKLLQKIFNCLVMNYEISHGLRDVNGKLVLMGGNTRLMVYTSYDKHLPVKIIDYDKEFDFKAEEQEFKQRQDLFKESVHILNDREKEILYARRLNDVPSTLDELSKKYKISRERIRQIENKAFEKLQKCMLNAAKSKNLLPAN